MKLDRCVLAIFFPKFDFQATPSSLETLSSDILAIMVEYLYKGVIPKDANVESVYTLKSFCDQRPEFSLLSDALKEFIRGKAAKDREFVIFLFLRRLSSRFFNLFGSNL